MKLIEALETLRCPVADAAPEFNVSLACGISPLHLQTFLAAELRKRLPENRVVVRPGFYGDLLGNIQRLNASAMNSLALVIEWADFDPRLGIRTLAGWRPMELPNIVESATQMAGRLQNAIREIAQFLPVIVCLPTLPLPPMFSTKRAHAGQCESQLLYLAASLANDLARVPGVRLLSVQTLADISPFSCRYDIKSELATGFPYTLSHASAIGDLLSRLIAESSPKKGLITDLDDTLWAGVLGEDGVDGISWELDRHTQMHGVFQHFLSSLAGAGVLVGVASKNDPANVERAFERSDLYLTKNDIYPLEVHWSPKSNSVRRILETWNVSADSVVFVDDSSMELAEVKAVFPELECMLFPRGDDQAIWQFLRNLRDLFGKSVVTEDDALRLRSIRDADAWRAMAQSPAASLDEFLKAAEAVITFEPVLADASAREFELINKTNQFNLNGRRLIQSEWRALFNDPDAFVLSVSYKDKFGPLGKVMVVAGKAKGQSLILDSWVLSCRAFSRRIEHRCLSYLFETFSANQVTFEFSPTPKNAPVQELLTQILGRPPEPGATLTREQFETKVPPLFQRVEGKIHAST